MIFTVRVNGEERQVELRRTGAGWDCRVDIDGELRALDAAEVSPGRFSILLEGVSYEAHVEGAGGAYRVHTGGTDLTVEVEDPRRWRGRGSAGAGHDGRLEITAPMPGKIIRVLVDENQEVTEGDGLVVIEAMKMQNEIPSPKSGVVEKVHVEAGGTVEQGAPLVVIA